MGRNGHGKTTLFRIVIGEESADDGAVVVPRNYRLGYVRQTIEFTGETVLKEGMRGLPEAESDHYWKVEKILAGLGFFGKRHEKTPRRVFRRIPGPSQPRQGFGFRTRHASAGRTHQLSGHRVDSMDRTLPRVLAPRDRPDHPRPQLHGQDRHPYRGNPPEKSAKNRGRYRKVLRPDGPGRGNIGKDPPERGTAGKGNRKLHQPISGQGPLGQPGPIPGEDPAEDGKGRKAPEIENPRFFVPEQEIRRKIRHDRKGSFVFLRPE